MDFSLDDINPFKEGGVLGPQHPVAGQQPGVDPDKLEGARAEQHRQDYLYGGSETGAQDFNAGVADFNAGVQQTADYYGNSSVNTGQAYGSELTGMGRDTYGQGAGYAATGAGAINSANPDLYVDQGSLNRSMQGADSMRGAADRLMSMNFNGPSAAEAQLNAGAAKTTAQNLALASTGRGMGGGASARRQAMVQNAQVMGATNADLATLRANEEATRAGQRMQAAQAAGGLYGGAAGIDAGNLATQASAGHAAVSDAYGLGTAEQQLALQAQQQGAGMVQAGGQTQLGALGQGAQVQQQGQQIQQQGQQLEHAVNTTALQGTTGFEGDMTDRRGQSINAQTTNQQNQQQNQAANVGMVSDLATSVGTAVLSDKREKTDIEPAEDFQLDKPSDGLVEVASSFLGGGGGGTTNAKLGKPMATAGRAFQQRAYSDVRAKTDIKRVPVDGRIFGDKPEGEPTQADRFAETLAEFKRNMGQEAERSKPEESASKRKLRSLMTGEPMQFHNIGTPDPVKANAPALRGIGAGKAASEASRLAGREQATGTPYGGPSGGGPSPREAAATVRQTPAYSYRYKDPERHGEGQRVGIMAQDLERTPTGEAAVMRSPEGTRMVDTGELSTINTAAIHNEQERTDGIEQKLADIEKRLAARDEAPRRSSSQPNLDDLDWAYQREASGWR